LLVGVLALSSCSIRPKGVLSNSKMVDALVEIHRVDGITQAANYSYGHDEQLAIYYAMALDKVGVTQAEFDSSLVWYTDHPQYFQRVYPKVIKRLQKMHDDEVALLAEQDEELKQAIADSMARAALLTVLPIRVLTLDETLSEMVRGLDTRLYHPLAPEELCTDSIWRHIEQAKKDSIEAVEQEKCMILEKNQEKICENQ